MALTDYSIDTSGSPQDVQRKQALADALMKQGSDSTPAAGGKNGGWVTALNRGLAGALGGYQRGQADQMDQEGRAQHSSNMSALVQALTGGQQQAAPTPPMGMQPAPSAAPMPAKPTAAALADDGEDTPAPIPVSAPGASSGMPTFGANGRMMGNLTGNVGQPPAPIAAAPAVAAPSPIAAPSRAQPAATAALMSVMNDPRSSPQEKQMAASILEKNMTPKDSYRQETDKDGNVWNINSNTGQRTVALQGEKTPASGKEYEYYLSHLGPNEQPMAYSAWSDKKARAAATNVNTNVDTRAETEQSKAIGKAKGEIQAEDIKAGSHASIKLRQLATLDDANKNGGDDISSGPLGKAILSGKQGFSELTGIDLKGVPESEVIQKVGFGLATNMVKAITNRPSQMEFGKALENVPGLYMSKQGRVAMTSILTQDARAEQDLGRLANKHRDAESGPTWQEVKDKYYEEHPLMSPFTGKPFGESDVQMLTKTAPKGTAAPGAPVVINGYTIKER